MRPAAKAGDERQANGFRGLEVDVPPPFFHTLSHIIWEKSFQVLRSIRVDPLGG